MNRPALQPVTDADDARKLSPEAQHAKRLRVIQLYLRGFTQRQIAVASGLSNTAVARVIKLYQSGGETALQPQVRGRRTQSNPKVAPESTIQQFICGAFIRKLETH